MAFAGFQLLVSWIIDRWDPGLRDLEYARKRSLLRARIADEPRRPLVLALGTSRTAYGLRPGAVAPAGTKTIEPLVFNFGIIGGGPLFELVFLNRLLADGIRPATVLIEVHPALLHDVDDVKAAQAPVIERCDARDLAVLLRFAARPMETCAKWLRLRLAPCHWYRHELLACSARNWLTGSPLPMTSAMAQTDRFGWTPCPLDAPSDEVRRRRGRAMMEAYEQAFRDFTVSATTDRALREMLDICRRARIDAALVIMPEESEYRRTFTTRTHARTEAYLSRLCGDYGIPLFDARDWCGDRDFGDAQHLLSEGAQRFTAAFAGDHLRDWLAENRIRPAASVARQPGKAIESR